VATDYKTNDGFRLGFWVSNQRAKAKDHPDRRQRLEALPGWSWNTFSDKWEKSFFKLQSFLAREGHCRVPQSYKTDDGFRLGSWVSNQRTNKHTMDPDRQQRLEGLPGWIWKVEK
jgi:helicase associated protein